MSEGEQEGPQRKDSFVQTDIAGAVNLPMEEADAAGGAEVAGATPGDATLPDVDEEEFRRGDFLESTRIENPDAEQPDAEQPDAGQPDAGQPDAEQPDAEQPDAEQPDAEQPEAGQPDAEQPDAEQPDAEQPDAPATEEVAEGVDPAQNTLVGDAAADNDAPSEPPAPPAAEEVAEASPDIVEGPLEVTTDVHPETADFEDLPDDPSIAENQQPPATAPEAEEPAPEQPAPGQEIEVALTAQGDPRFVSVDPCCATGPQSIQQRFAATLSPADERWVTCDTDSQIMVRRTEECFEIRSRDSPSCESIYHDALSTPPEETPLMKTTVRLTIMAKAKNPAAQQLGSNACAGSEVAQMPRSCGDDRESRLAKCAADSVLRLMAALEKKGTTDRSARMVLSPRGLVVCLKPSGQRKCCQRESGPSASDADGRSGRPCCSENQPASQCPPSRKSDRPAPTKEDSKLRPCCREYLAKQRPLSRESRPPSRRGCERETNPCCDEHDKRPPSRESKPPAHIDDDEAFRLCCKDIIARRLSSSRECEHSQSNEDEQLLRLCCEGLLPTTKKKPSSRAIGVQTDEVMDNIPEEESSEEDSCPPMQSFCTCDDIENGQSWQEEQFYSAVETFTEIPVGPCPRPQDDFMNPFPCPYYPACLGTHGHGRQEPNVGADPQLRNVTYTVNPAPATQNSYREGSPCTEPPDSGYASSRGEINNATYVISRDPHAQNCPGHSPYNATPSAPSSMQPPCAAEVYPINGPPPFHPNQVPFGDYAVPSPAGGTNMGCPQNFVFNDNPYNSNPINQQFQPEFRQNERMFFTCEGNLNQQNLQLNCQLPSAMNFMEGPPPPRMGGSSNRCQHQPERTFTQGDQLLGPSAKQVHYNLAGGGPQCGDSSPHDKVREGLCLHKKDSLTPLKQEITRLEQIVNRIVEVAAPLTEYFSQCQGGLPALTAPQEIAERPSAGSMDRCRGGISGNELSSAQSRTATYGANTKSRAQGFGIFQERPQASPSGTRDLLSEMENMEQGLSRNERMADRSRNGQGFSPAATFPEAPAFNSASGVGLSRNNYNGIMEANSMAECQQFLEELGSQPSYGSGIFGQEEYNPSNQSILCECPISPFQENNKGFDDLRCSDYTGSSQTSRQQLEYNHNLPKNMGLNMNFHFEAGNDYHLGGGRGWVGMVGNPGQYTTTSQSNHKTNHKNLPAICDKHREQANRRGLF